MNRAGWAPASKRFKKVARTPSHPNVPSERCASEVPAPTECAVVLAQGGYYVASGMLPFVSRRAFEAVTGPKREWWLVQTVGALVTVIGCALLVTGVRRRDNHELVGVAAGSAAALAAIDVVYVAKRRISPTYLLDAAVQLALLGGLTTGRYRRRSRSPDPG